MHILAKSLTKRYRDGNQSRAVLDGTDFAIDLSQGPVAITGASGSGKSTLLALLGGLDVPGDGTLRIGEFELSSMNGDQRSNFRLKTCGFIFQEFNLMGTLRVWENVALPAVFAGTSFTDVRERAYQLLEDVDCGDLKERLPHEISGGQMQRVAIARALINKPELILADEPTGNLDERSSKQVMSTLLQVASSGVGLVMVTHDPSIAQNMPQHFQVRDGHVVQEPK